MSKQNCGHEHVCVECVKAEIAKVETKLRELKAKLPNTIIINTGCGCSGSCHHHWPSNPPLTNNQYLLQKQITPALQSVLNSAMIKGMSEESWITPKSYGAQ